MLASSLVINEFLANPTSPASEWVEFYNPDNIDLSSYWIDDDTDFSSDSGNSLKKQLLLIDISNSTFPVFTLSSYIFNNTCGTSCDYVVLFSSTGTIVDQYQYTTEQIQQQGKSIGRSPDNSNSWTVFDTSTKGSTNNTSSSPSSPTPSTNPTSSPDSSTTPTSFTSSSFTISNSPSQINSDQPFTISVNLSLSDKPNTSFYIKGAFKKSDSSNYFGFTKVGSSWIKNSDTYTNQFKINTDSSGNWSGNLEVKPDSSDSGFTGTGDYSFKLGKYDSQDPSPSVSWSNETTTHITGNQTSSSTPTSTPKPTATPNSSTATKAGTSFVAPSVVPDTNTPQLPILGLSTSSAEATPEAYANFKQSKTPGIAMIIGGLIIIAGAAGTYLRYKRTHVQS